MGRVIEAEIASLRAEIDWGEARLDFVFLFSPGVLEAAPHTFAAAVDVPPASEAALLDRLADGPAQRHADLGARAGRPGRRGDGQDQARGRGGRERDAA